MLDDRGVAFDKGHGTFPSWSPLHPKISPDANVGGVWKYRRDDIPPVLMFNKLYTPSHFAYLHITALFPLRWQVSASVFVSLDCELLKGKTYVRAIF